MSNVEGMEQMYIDLINPKVLLEHFESDEDFIDWLRIGTVEEMGWALKAFENEELYRHCSIIKKEIERGNGQVIDIQLMKTIGGKDIKPNQEINATQEGVVEDPRLNKIRRFKGTIKDYKSYWDDRISKGNN